MSRISVKQVISGTLVSALMVMQLPTPTWAATDPNLSAAVTAGTKYLAANQNSAGMIGAGSADNDWSVIAMKAAGKDPSTLNNGSGVSAVDFMASDAPAATAPATDIERRILAINAAGKDSSDFGGIDYNAKLKSFYNANQIGGTTLLNDDIFGIIAIAATHDSTLEPIAQDSINFLLAHQLSDGGFSWTTPDSCDWGCASDTNDTAAAIVAIDAAKNMSLTNPNLAAAEDKALNYLLSPNMQQPDGGFGQDVNGPSDPGSTSWVLMALNVSGPTANIPAQAARKWLLANQNLDGGFSGWTGSSDASTTAPAILALLGTTWLLNPAPIQVTPPTPPIPVNIVPAAAPAAAASTPAPASNATADTSRPVALPTTDLAAAIAPTTSAPTGEVKGASQTQPALTQSLNTTSKPNTALYGLLVLLAVAAIWYVIQSTTRKKV